MGGSNRWVFGSGACLAALLGAGCATHRQVDHRQVIETGLEPFYRAQAQVEPMVTDRLQFFDGGPAIKSAMLEMVRNARDYLLIDTFLLNDGPEAREVLEAIVEKHRQGVRVYLIGDSSSRFVSEGDAFGFLEAKGVPGRRVQSFGANTTGCLAATVGKGSPQILDYRWAIPDAGRRESHRIEPSSAG